MTNLKSADGRQARRRASDRSGQQSRLRRPSSRDILRRRQEGGVMRESSARAVSPRSDEPGAAAAPNALTRIIRDRPDAAARVTIVAVAGILFWSDLGALGKSPRRLRARGLCPLRDSARQTPISRPLVSLRTARAICIRLCC